MTAQRTAHRTGHCAHRAHLALTTHHIPPNTYRPSPATYSLLISHDLLLTCHTYNSGEGHPADDAPPACQ